MSGFTLGTWMWVVLIGHLLGDFITQNDIQARNKASSTAWCLLHVVLYTATMLICLLFFESRWLHPLWVLGIAVPHFVIDRFRLARRWMWLAGQEDFATGPLAPWSVVVVDQIMHMTCLFVTVILFTALDL